VNFGLEVTTQTETYDVTSDNGHITLTEEITPDAFLAAMSAEMPDYEGPWLTIGGIPDNDFGSGAIAYRSYNKVGCSGLIEKAQYYFDFNPSVQATVVFYTIFYPLVTGSQSPLPAKLVGTQSIGLHESSITTAPVEIDSYTVPNTFTEDNAFGSYGVIRAASLSASGYLPDYTTSSGYDAITSLDPAEKTESNLVLRPANPDGQGALSATVTIQPRDVTGGVYTLSWDNADDFLVYHNGQLVTSPFEIGADHLGPFLDNGQFTIIAKSSAANGETLTMSLTAKTADGQSFGSDQINFTTNNTPTYDYTVPFSEASGARYRKIALNGRPMADEKPHETAESDEEKEESYIDALTLGLHHSTTDIYVHLPGSDLPLSIRRDTLSEVWNMRNGLRPHERLDRPFGAGWSANLCPSLEIIRTGQDQIETDVIIDQNGASHTFIPIVDPDGSFAGYVPVPGDARENSDYQCTYDGGTFVDRYGTAITFDGTHALVRSVMNSRDNGTEAESHLYLPAKIVTDRLGNTLNYQYPANSKTLVPATISLAADPTQCISIAQDAGGYVTTIWDPNGQAYQYSYSAHTFDDVNDTETVLASVIGPDGKHTDFTYDYAKEDDLTPPDLNNGQPVPKYHIDIKTISDPKGNTYTFSYQVDHTKLEYNLIHNFVIQTGAPRNVVQVDLPGNLGSAFFDHSGSLVEVLRGADGLPSLSANSQRVAHVTDAVGKQITYSFGGAQVFDVQGTYPNTPVEAIPKVVFYTTMNISYGPDAAPLGSESFNFDPSAGLALSLVTDFSGNVTSYEYNDPIGVASLYQKAYPVAGFAGKRPDPTAQTDALLHSKNFHYTGVFRIMDSMLDEDGRLRTYDVDVFGRRLNEIVYAGGDNTTAVVQETDYAYDNVNFPGVVTQKTVKDFDHFDWTTDMVTEYDLDEHGRIQKEIVDPNGLHLETDYTYDLNGNKLSVTDPKGYVTAFEYSVRNWLLKVVYPEGAEKLLGYDDNGNKTSETDENLHVTGYDYDSLNRLTTVTRVVSGGNLVTQYDYNAVNSKTSVTDPMGKVTVMEYDDLQRLSKTTDALLKVTNYYYDGLNAGASAFDSAGFKPTSVRDPRGYVTTNHYDALYRLTSKVQQYALAPNETFATTSYGYDNVGNPKTVTDDRTNTTTTDFDALNRPYHVTYADTKDVSTFFTSTGLKWKVTDELGKETETHYDAAGRAVLIEAPAVDDGLDPADLCKRNLMPISILSKRGSWNRCILRQRDETS